MDLRRKPSPAEAAGLVRNLERLKRFTLTDEQLEAWVIRLCEFPDYQVRYALRAMADSDEQWVDCGKIVSIIRNANWREILPPEAFRLEEMRAFNSDQKKLGFKEIKDENLIADR